MANTSHGDGHIVVQRPPGSTTLGISVTRIWSALNHLFTDSPIPGNHSGRAMDVVLEVPGSELDSWRHSSSAVRLPRRFLIWAGRVRPGGRWWIRRSRWRLGPRAPLAAFEAGS